VRHVDFFHCCCPRKGSSLVLLGPVRTVRPNHRRVWRSNLIAQWVLELSKVYTTATAHGAALTSFCDSLPGRSPLRRVSPRLPTTIKSALARLAAITRQRLRLDVRSTKAPVSLRAMFV
jgi:hypothetical protein